jgi:ATP-dependent exoDNAse (exonuclease V) alpha subunit
MARLESPSRGVAICFIDRAYIGVTRGKRLVVLVGQRKALAIAVKGARARRRCSKLGERLG